MFVYLVEDMDVGHIANMKELFKHEGADSTSVTDKML